MGEQESFLYLIIKAYINYSTLSQGLRIAG